MTSASSNFYVFKFDECFNKWKRVIYAIWGCVLLLLLMFIFIVATGAVNINNATASIFGSTQYAQALTQPYGDVPGTTFLNKAYNVLNGHGFDSADANAIGEFTHELSKTVRVNGVVGYEADQISIIVNPQCESTHKRSSKYKSGSFGIIMEQSESFSYGKELSIGNTKYINKTEANRFKFRLSLAFGQSKMMRASLSFKGTQYSDEYIVSSRAKLLDAKVNWYDPSVPFKYDEEFVEALKRNAKKFRNNRERNKALWRFSSRYGTHVIERAEFGAMCHACVVTHGASGSVHATVAGETNQFGSVSGLGFELSGAEYNRVGVELTGAGGYKYQIAYKSCDGLMSVNPCNANMKSGIDEPVMTRFKLIPIVKLKIKGVDENGIWKNGVGFSNELYEAFYKCVNKQCNGNGACVVKSSLWSNGGFNDWNGSFDDYTVIFEAGVCIEW